MRGRRITVVLAGEDQNMGAIAALDRRILSRLVASPGFDRNPTGMGRPQADATAALVR